MELNGLIGGEYIKLDIGVGYVKQSRTEILEGLGPSGVFNYEKGSFYHYNLRAGFRFSAYTNENTKLFFRMSTGRNFTPKKLIRNYLGEESNSSKLIPSELFGIICGVIF